QPLRNFWVGHDGVEAAPGRARLPVGVAGVMAQGAELGPSGAVVQRLKQGRVLDAREQRFAAAGIGDGLEGPRAPELPRLRLTRKALVRLHRRDVLKLALQGRPRPSAVVAALDHV